MKGAEKRKGFLWLFIFLGAILGSVLGDAIGNNFSFLSLFKDSYSVGMTEPVVLNLKVMTATFGVNFKVNIMTIIGIIMAIILYRKY
ncbi:DUF4321 domain-containing protein [Clostridium luticellarii]|uniref:DUF4321 domain-containing protein n=1 Tax=Clostridium luticellarii TaxID=1691940 RepID=A0A2T0BPD8_9CLOT|nr:DUF4321 domain-containing protein [Clostridium luticellarii]MCI1945812.1 DUF4321 domain-containing protein [Clostridium luticellarii]MCI1967592.1 DUF4321 domain-containing protein [Clostridium luticellarii]MCI1995710.1 DUF4321 domain-containing protein [Clostridium luticellarii]MCI2040048.1 DUF4321 domain-containing protein [Clostridium luticellarii]PRR85748.1 hypothetical protein CLLU_12370 [Clostridium luticellarii]